MKYGSNIRAITDILLTPQNEEQYLGDIRAGAAKFADTSSAVMLDLQSLEYGSDQIFALRCEKGTLAPYLTIPTTFLVTTLGVALSRKAAAERHKALVLLDSNPSLYSAAGWIFEHSAHATLSDPNRSRLRTYIDGKLSTNIPPVKRMISGSDALREIQQPFDFYWRPRGPISRVLML
jgi:hypothetical protein